MTHSERREMCRVSQRITERDMKTDQTKHNGWLLKLQSCIICLMPHHYPYYQKRKQRQKKCKRMKEKKVQIFYKEKLRKFDSILDDNGWKWSRWTGDTIVDSFYLLQSFQTCNHAMKEYSLSAHQCESWIKYHVAYRQCLHIITVIGS